MIDITNRGPKSNAVFCKVEVVKNVKSQLFFKNKMHIKT